MAPALTPPQMVKAFRSLANDKEWRKELRKTYREVAKVATGLSRVGMRSSGDRQLAAAAAKIRGSANTTTARVSVPRGRAAAAVYGTKGPTGWFGNARHAGTLARNNPPYIGQVWKVAQKGEGPRGINDALADGKDQIVDSFADAAGNVIKRAVTNGARTK